MAAIVSKKTYLKTWIVLEILLGAIYSLSLIHMGPVDLVVPLVLATVQMVLVILFFMHVRYSRGLIWVIIGAGFLWFLILIDLTMSDYVTRGFIWWLANSR